MLLARLLVSSPGPPLISTPSFSGLLPDVRSSHQLTSTLALLLSVVLEEPITGTNYNTSSQVL